MNADVDTALYTARIGESYSLAERESYPVLLERIVEFTVRGAIARSVEEDDWEHEQLRRRGLAAIQVVRDGKAVWTDRSCFEGELAEARREQIEERFRNANQFDAAFYDKLDKDLRSRWGLAGYHTPSLKRDMRRLFSELQRDAAARAADARDRLVEEILHR